MKRLLLISLSICLAALTLSAQAPFTVQYSNPFEEPEGLESKVIQVSNGNTFLFVFTKKDGIKATLYGKDRKVVAVKTYEGKEWEKREMIKSEIDGTYEINGKLVMFLEQLIDRTPALFRLIIDPATGAMVEETKIGTMPKYKAFAGYAMAFGGVDPKTFYVEKDPFSDYYAVIAFDGFASETDNRIVIQHFNGNHQEINKAYYDGPNSQYKFIDYIGSVVDGDKAIYMATYAYNTKASGGATSKVIFSRLNADSKTIEHHPLDGTLNFKDTKAIMSYNPGYNTIELMTLSELNSGNKFSFGSGTREYTYRLLLTSLDPKSMTVLYSKPVAGEKASEYKRLHCNKKTRFAGMPMNMVINEDYSTTIVMEEQITVSRTSGSHTTVQNHMKDIGVVTLDERGQETDGFAIQKAQQTSIMVPTLSHHFRDKNYVGFERSGMIHGYANSGFYSFDYLSTKKGRYVIFNDDPDNFSRDERKEPDNVRAISGTNSVCYKLEDGKFTKSYLFGNPPKDENRFSFISSSNFQKSTQTYATLMLENIGRKKMAKVAWVSFN